MSEADRVAKKLRRSGVMFVLATVLLVSGVVYAVWGIESVDHRVTVLEDSPCTRDPASAVCQQIRRDASKATTTKDACILIRKGGYPCPVGEVQQRIIERREVAQQGSSPSQSSGPSHDGPPNRPDGPVPPMKPPATPPPVGPPENPPVTPPPVAPPVNSPDPPSAPKPLVDLGPTIKPVCDLTRPLISVC